MPRIKDIDKPFTRANANTGIPIKLLKNCFYAVFDATIEILKEEIENNNNKDAWVYWKNRLSLGIVKRKPRMTRNPKTGEKIQLPERNKVKVKVAKELRKLNF